MNSNMKIKQIEIYKADIPFHEPFKIAIMEIKCAQSVFIKIITGNIPINKEDIEIISTDKATITTNFPVSFQIDGEYCGEQTKLEIEIFPKQMKIAVP